MTDRLNRKYLSAESGYAIEREVTPARASAMSLFEAQVRLREAEQALAAARARVPSYTGSSSDIDYYGDELEAMNRAIDDFEDAVVASVSEAAQRRLSESMSGIGPQT